MDAKYWCLLVFFCALLSACGGKVVDSGAVVQERYRDRIQALSSKLLESCRDDVIEAATLRADSLLIERARRIRRIEGRPPRPSRPGVPAVKELSSPLPLRPLFPFEIRFDTLLRDSLFQDSLRLDSIDRALLLEEEL